MAKNEQIAKEQVATQVSRHLSQTRYACSSLTRVSGGSVNFVFRGVLVHPLLGAMGAIAARTIIVKHSAASLASNRDFLLDVSRCSHEEAMLDALGSFSPANVSVKTPRLYLFDGEMKTQVLEDVPNAVDLTSILTSPEDSRLLAHPIATFIGRKLGSWLRAFHAWSSAPEQAALRADIAQNEPMRKLKYQITYNAFVEVLENFPEILERDKATLQDVKYMAMEEFKQLAEFDMGENCGIIHGDFWAGNVLVTSATALEKQQSEDAQQLFVIDWEFAQFGHRAYDLGQMIGDLYERKHFKDVECSIWAIQGFVEGYGGVSDEMAYRIAIHAGVHLICWYIRRAPAAPLKGTPERIIAAMEIGMDFIVRGWKKDKVWFENSVLAPLFISS
ncbi:Kinase-like domain-containing protein [Pleurostoma richardsiae]|uniref:Kinase-like domain-containing protein n=1 Tax=Pleurostoma richardsiae TaxID=41990 RepID=A0AA38VHK7_9PEZI|nr:Kinase-like domain-containing protein [Pleurostoma richardsiae]